MSVVNYYISDDSEFCWEDNHAPKRTSPFFPPIRAPSMFSYFDEWVEANNVYAEKVDWGAKAAAVTKKQLQAFIGHCYDSDPSYTDPDKMLRSQGRAYLVEQLNMLKEYVNGLDDKREYGLVVCEI